MNKAAVVSFFNGLGDTVLLLPILRYLSEKYTHLLIFANSNSKPFLNEFKNVYFTNNDFEIQNFQFNSVFTSYQWDYYDYNITFNPIQEWIKDKFKPASTFNYDRIQNSEMKEEYELNNMFFKQFIQSDIWAVPENINRSLVIPDSHVGLYSNILNQKKGIITMHTDTDKQKQWSWHSWYTLISCLQENLPDYQIILLGFPDTLLKLKGVQVAPDLYSCLEAIKVSSFFVGVDSVFSHVADASNTNGVVLFNAVNHKDWKPSGKCLHYLISSEVYKLDISITEVLNILCKYLDIANDPKDLLTKMYSKDYRLIERAPKDILQDLNLIRTIIMDCPYIYPYLDIEIKRNKEINQDVVSSFWYMLSFVPEECRTDDLCLNALKQNGWALDFVNDNLKQKREIVAKALESQGDALEFSIDKFKSDRTLVKLAVQSNGMALRYADMTLRHDPEILSLALNENPFAIEFAPFEIRHSPEWIDYCVKRCPDVNFLLNKINEDGI